ncbi:MAG: GNAT family N-acetyltransferase [Flavobacterium sp.]
MKTQALQISQLTTERLILIPYTLQICNGIINDDFNDLFKMGLQKGKSWPDEDVIETLPKIINNLSKVEAPTGFESWMIIKKDTLEIIGDLGFKGYNQQEENIDLGYGIIKEERRKGYAEEAATGIINWALTYPIVKEITARCLTANTGSIKLLQKLNFTETKQADGMIHWSLTKI